MDKYGEIFGDFTYLIGTKTGDGDEQTIRCPDSGHRDETPSASFNVKTGLWYCHACSAKGNHVSYAQLTGKALRPEYRPIRFDQRTANGVRSTTLQFRFPPELTLPGKRDDVFLYFQLEDGTVAPAGGCVLVARVPRKKFNRFTCSKSGKLEYKGLSDPLPYSLALDLGFRRSRSNSRKSIPLLWIDSDKPILIVEGEKCARIAHKYLNKQYEVLSWMGGTGSVLKTDWSLLQNRNVYLWPDHDTPGKEAMLTLSERLRVQ